MAGGRPPPCRVASVCLSVCLCLFFLNEGCLVINGEAGIPPAPGCLSALEQHYSGLGERAGLGALWGWGHHSNGAGGTIGMGMGAPWGWGRGHQGALGTMGMGMGMGGGTEGLGAQWSWGHHGDGARGSMGLGAPQGWDHRGVLDASSRRRDAAALKIRCFIHQRLPTRPSSSRLPPRCSGSSHDPRAWPRILATAWHRPAITRPCPGC